MQRLQRQNKHDQPERDETLHIRTKKSRRGSDESDTAQSATVSNENDIDMEEDSESDIVYNNNDDEDGSMSDDSSCNSDDEEAEGDDQLSR